MMATIVERKAMEGRQLGGAPGVDEDQLPKLGVDSATMTSHHQKTTGGSSSSRVGGSRAAAGKQEMPNEEEASSHDAQRNQRAGEEMRGGCGEFVLACAKAGDLDCALTVMAKLRARGIRVGSDCLDLFFQPEELHDQLDAEAAQFASSSSSPASTSSATAECPRGSESFSPAHLSMSPPTAGRSLLRSIRSPNYRTPPYPPYSITSHYSPWVDLMATSPPDFNTTRLHSSLSSSDSAASSPSSSPLCLKAPGEAMPPPLLCLEEEEELAAEAKEEHTKWQNLPEDLLLSILEWTDHQTVVAAWGVCKPWSAAVSRVVQELSLTWCRKGVNSFLSSASRRLSNLKTLNLRRCQFLSDDALKSVAANCPSLSCLLLCNSPKLTDASLIAVAASCRSLEVLDLSACGGITERGLMAMARGCQQLREINLCGNRQSVTDHAIFSISRFCSHLEVLNLGWCEQVSDSSLVALARGCSKMRVLDLCGCLSITDAGLMALLEACLQLQGLGLHCCRQITDQSMIALIRNGQRRNQKAKAVSRHSSYALRKPNTSKIFIMPSVLYIQPPISHDGLVSLNVSGCMNLHAPTVQAVVNVFPGLHTCPEKRSLNIGGCMALTAVQCHCMTQSYDVEEYESYRFNRHRNIDLNN